MGAPQATGLGPNGSGCRVQKQRGPAASREAVLLAAGTQPGTDVVGATELERSVAAGLARLPGTYRLSLGAAIRQAPRRVPK